MVAKPEPPVKREDVCYIREGGTSYCIDPLDRVLGVISKRWGLFVVGVLGNQREARFNELKRSIPGIAARALSERLADLQGLGLVARKVIDASSPPAVLYSLTPRGRAMRRALIPFLEWAGA